MRLTMPTMDRSFLLKVGNLCHVIYSSKHSITVRYLPSTRIHIQEEAFILLPHADSNRCLALFLGKGTSRRSVTLQSGMEPTSYAANLGNIVSSGFVSCALALDKNLGVLDALQKAERPLSAEDLAESCGLKKRYVEEWLGSMVASSIVFINKEEKYFIPEDCKKYLMATDFTPLVFIIGEVHKKTVECFKKDGPFGYNYSKCIPNLGDFLDSRVGFDSMVDEILVPVRLVKDPNTINLVLDVGCGQGCLSRKIAKHLPDVKFHGSDLCEDYIKNAESIAKAEGIKNLSYSVHNLEDLPEEWTKKFDWIMMYDVLHDLPHPKPCMDEVKRVLKDDGVATIVDPKLHSQHKDNAGNITAGSGYAISCFICLPNSSMDEFSAQNGIGWGEQKKQNFLEKNGWIVNDKRQICGNHYAYMFTCSKKM